MRKYAPWAGTLLAGIILAVLLLRGGVQQSAGPRESTPTASPAPQYVETAVPLPTATVAPETPTASPVPRATPSEAPGAAVAAFYSLVAARRYDDAYAQLSPSFQATMPLASFRAGYDQTQQLTYSIDRVDGDRVNVRVASVTATQSGSGADLYWGTWTLVPNAHGNRWLLDEGHFTKQHIADVQTPQQQPMPSQYGAPAPVAPPPSPESASAPDDSRSVRAAEPDCDEETIDEVERDGKVITTLTGALFLVNDVDTVTTSIWLPTDDLQACTNDGRHFKLVHGDEAVSATKIIR